MKKPVFRWIRAGVTGLFVDNQCRFIYERLVIQDANRVNTSIYTVQDLCRPVTPGTVVYGARTARKLCLYLHDLKELP